MRSIIITFIAAICITVSTSCSKDDTPEPDSSTSVTINGQVLQVVEIGGRLWTTTNYNGDGGMIHPQNTGKLYTYTEAQAIPLPEGWRIPTREDYLAAMISQGITSDEGGLEASKKFMSTTGWTHVQGTNTSGFNAIPSGYFSTNLIGSGTNFWTWTSSTTQVGGSTHRYIFYVDSFGATEVYTGIDHDSFTNQRLPIRFVKTK